MDYHAKGMEYGASARDPMEILQEGDVNRDEFLRGYALGLQKFLKVHGIEFHFGAGNCLHPKNFVGENIGKYVLIGYIKGLRCESPQTGSISFENYDPSETGPWTSGVLRGIQNLIVSEAYVAGFMIGLARDYEIILKNINALPDSKSEYDVFLAGTKGEPFIYPIWRSHLNWYDDFNREYDVTLHKWCYETGLAVREKSKV